MLQQDISLGFEFQEMSKYTIIAYILWLFAGWFGVHHFYLGRDRQGLLWLTSFAGMMGLGWMRDFWKIPTYVKDANQEPAYMGVLGAEMRYYKKPAICHNLHRIVGQLMFGWFYRAVVYNAIPEEYYSSSFILTLLLPLGSAFGTYMVSNCGRIKSSFSFSLAGAYLGELMFGEPHLVYMSSSVPSFAVGVSMLFSTYQWEYRRSYKKHGCCKRMAVWALVIFIFCGLCTSFIYFNATVMTEDGETVRVREAVNNFLKSPAWFEIKSSFWKIYDDFKEDGWEGARRRVIILADVEGEDHALLVLGLERGASIKQIKERYRELAKEWHPDHHQGSGEDKAQALEKFMEIQKAYETLNSLYGKRKKG